MTGMGALAVVLAGAGAWTLALWWHARRAVLADRVAPGLRPVETARWVEQDAAPATAVTPWPSLERLLAPVLRDAARLIGRWGSSATSLESRLRRAGWAQSPEQFRGEQAVMAAVCLGVALALSVGLAVARGASPLALLAMSLAAAGAGAAAHDLSLSRAVRAREQRVLAELPVLAELLALAVSAGEGALGAVERVARSTEGALTDDLRAILGEVRAGRPLTDALVEFGAITGVAPLRRFVEGIAVAVERGTPLADVLYAQAMDVREAGRRSLMEAGGKKEIAMMVPVIFLILPVTVVFAVFPGIVAITLST